MTKVAHTPTMMPRKEPHPATTPFMAPRAVNTVQASWYTHDRPVRAPPSTTMPHSYMLLGRDSDSTTHVRCTCTYSNRRQNLPRPGCTRLLHTPAHAEDLLVLGVAPAPGRRCKVSVHRGDGARREHTLGAQQRKFPPTARAARYTCPSTSTHKHASELLPAQQQLTCSTCQATRNGPHGRSTATMSHNICTRVLVSGLDGRLAERV